MPEQPHTAFFYGTLMAPAVLQRVTSHSPDSCIAPLTSRPALLHGHRRHRVRGADYPAVVPFGPSSGATGNEAGVGATGDGAKVGGGECDVDAGEESSVRGTVVHGLTPSDIWRLDLFEGDEYARRKVRVTVLPPDADSAALGQNQSQANGAEDSHGDGKSVVLEPGQTVEAETYIWIAGQHRLEDSEWDFEEFVREKMWRWAPAPDPASERDGGGAGGRGNGVGEDMEEDAGFEDVRRAVEAREMEKDRESKDDATGGRLLGGGFEDAVKEGRKGVGVDEVVESAV